MSEKQIELKVLDQRIHTLWGLPQYQTLGSAAVDLVAAIDEPITIPEGECVLVPTGIAISISDPSIAAVILPRSGLGHKQGLVLGNGTGLIDSDYQGQLMVSLTNRNQPTFEEGEDSNLAEDLIEGEQEVASNLGFITLIDKSATINPGDRIAQMYFTPVVKVQFQVVDDFSTTTERNAGGFGSTGVSTAVTVNGVELLTEDEFYAQLKDCLAETLDVHLTLLPTPLDELGLDSLDLVELVMYVEDEFGIEVTDSEFEEAITVDSTVPQLTTFLYGQYINHHTQIHKD